MRYGMHEMPVGMQLPQLAVIRLLHREGKYPACPQSVMAFPEYIREIAKIAQHIHRDNKIVGELKESVKAKDTGKIRSLLIEAQRDRMNLDDVASRIEEIEREAEAMGEDVSTLGKNILEYARTTATKPLDLGEFAQMSERIETASRVKELADEIRTAQKELDWKKLLPMYEELVRLNPDDQELMKRKMTAIQSLQKAISYEKKIQKSNIETLILQGVTPLSISKNDLLKQIDIVDKISRSVFGKTDNYEDPLPYIFNH